MNKKNIILICCTVLGVVVIGVGMFFLGKASNNTVPANASNIVPSNSDKASNNTNDKSSNNNKQNQITEMKLNEEYTITRRDGEEYIITFEGARETKDRNQFSDLNPTKVIFIDYNYKNISCETDVYVSSMSFKVMDSDGNILDTYPVSDETRNAKSVPIGAKSTGTEAFALMNDSKTITILYYDYSSKPLGKLVVDL